MNENSLSNLDEASQHAIENKDRSVLKNRLKIQTLVKENRYAILSFIVAFLLTFTTSIHYIFTMLLWTNPGFTLDDSWIHLQFARTIYEGHPWEYSPGYPCTGSTSPLWSILLSPLFLFTTETTGLIWGVYAIAIIFYVLSTFMVIIIVTDHTKNRNWGYVAALGFVLIPRNSWLMLSGMETPLFMFLLLLGLYLIERSEPKYDIALGVVVGLSYLARPEAVVLFLVCIMAKFFSLIWKKDFGKRRLLSFLGMGGIAIAIAIPWILYCYSTTGYPLPDTFYAKVHPPTEFEVSVWNNWWNFWILQFPYIMIGILGGVYLLFKRRPYIWIMGVSLLALYRFTTPYIALINNARYLVPVFDFLFLSSLVATVLLVQRLLASEIKLELQKDVHILISIVLVVLLIMPLMQNYFEQAPFYGNAVKNINEQQVQIGFWLIENTPEDAILAIHDAGALRFISNRSVIDLAGLVSPVIIHGNLSTSEKIQYLHDQGCEYFVFFDELFVPYGYYLAGAYTSLFTVTLLDNVISGRDVMSVYFINWSLSTFSI
ncbi:MAG: hypothetical protein ACXADL_01235 [Candidatus Thorarchaeota archaeon]